MCRIQITLILNEKKKNRDGTFNVIRLSAVYALHPGIDSRKIAFVLTLSGLFVCVTLLCMCFYRDNKSRKRKIEFKYYRVFYCNLLLHRMTLFTTQYKSQAIECAHEHEEKAQIKKIVYMY